MLAGAVVAVLETAVVVDDAEDVPPPTVDPEDVAAALPALEEGATEVDPAAGAALPLATDVPDAVVPWINAAADVDEVAVVPLEEPTGAVEDEATEGP